MKTREAIELEIENAWLELRVAVRPRTIFLTTTNRLVWGGAMRTTHAIEVGTYNSNVRLLDFREDTFFALEHRGDRRYG